VAVTIEIGRFTKKIQCQLMAWVSTPPASSPIEAPPPHEAVDADGASLLLARGTSSRSCEDHDEVSAPPTPCTKRAPMSSPWLSDRPHTSDAAVKIASR